MRATAPLTTQRTSILIYFLTAAEDEEVSNEIRRHLIPIVRESEIPIELIDNFDAPPGSERTRHQERLLTADIVISLISVDFLDDDALYKRNQQVIERHNLGQTVMMSILVRNCMWKVTPFAKLHVLPSHEPLNNKKYWNSEDDALASVAGDIYASINEITNVVVLPQGPVAAVGGSTGAESVVDDPAASPVGRSDAMAAEPRLVEPPSQPRTDWAAPAVEPQSQPRAAWATPAVEQEDSTSDWAAPVPQAGGGAGATTVAVSIATPATATLSVHWRQNFFRRVIWKRRAALLLDFTLLFFVPALIYGLVAGLLSTDASTDEVAFNVMLIAGLLAFYFLAPQWRPPDGVPPPASAS